MHLLGGRTGQAVDAYELAIIAARRCAARYYETAALLGLADAVRHDGALDRAESLYAEASSIATAVGYRVLYGRAVTGLAGVALAREDHDRARTLCEQALSVHRATGHRPGTAATFLVLAGASAGQGDTDRAARSYRAAHRLFTDIGATFLDGRWSSEIADVDLTR